ncbi:TPA: DUF3265 domain-containing protein [Vibrio diabolicus]|nr:DUF3265 domain-containing protein [Vibrio diabolicus]
MFNLRWFLVFKAQCRKFGIALLTP